MNVPNSNAFYTANSLAHYLKREALPYSIQRCREFSESLWDHTHEPQGATHKERFALLRFWCAVQALLDSGRYDLEVYA